MSRSNFPINEVERTAIWSALEMALTQYACDAQIMRDEG